MPIDPENAIELATIARKFGAEVVEGNLRYPSETGSWQLDEVDLGKYLDRYRDQRLMLVFVPLGEAETEPIICGVCGFVMDAEGECLQCELMLEDAARELEDRLREREQLFEDIDDFLERGEE